MARKRHKRKQKPKQDSKPAKQDLVQNETEQPVEQALIQTDAEQPGEQVLLQSEPEQPASSMEIEVEVIEETASSVVAIVEPEKPAPDSLPPAKTDRRTYPRYAFNAAVEVGTSGSGTRLKTRVRDLSQQGCFVDTESPLALETSTHVRIVKGTRAFEADARVVYNQPDRGMGLMFTAVEPEQRVTLHTWITESRETSWLAATRRRSQRVLMKIPVRISGQVGAGSPFEEDTYTLAVSAHGALMVVAAPVYRGQRFTLSNPQTKAASECVVVHVDKFQGQLSQVGVEFMLPNPTFWHVAFPPKDWTPRHPDAKSG